MKLNRTITLVIVTLVAVVAVFAVNNKSDDSSISPQIETEVLNESNNDATKEFKMIANQWTYDPDEIVVNVGDRVRLNIKSVDVTHSFTLLEFGQDEFGNPGINVVLEPNKEVQINFIADKVGEFVFGCNVVCGKGHSKMLGKLIVQ